jgi:hypothetical protein
MRLECRRNQKLPFGWTSDSARGYATGGNHPDKTAKNSFSPRTFHGGITPSRRESGIPPLNKQTETKQERVVASRKPLMILTFQPSPPLRHPIISRWKALSFCLFSCFLNNGAFTVESYILIDSPAFCNQVACNPLKPGGKVEDRQLEWRMHLIH